MTDLTNYKWWELDKLMWRPARVFLLWAAVVEGFITLIQLAADAL